MEQILNKIMCKVDVDSNTNCWVWKVGDGSHYPSFRCEVKNVVYNRPHRAICHIFHGPPGNLQVLHSCDNKKCVNPEHLRIGTPKENYNDAVERGLIHHKRTLSNEEVEFIRLYASAFTDDHFAMLFQTTKGVIFAARTGVTKYQNIFNLPVKKRMIRKVQGTQGETIKVWDNPKSVCDDLHIDKSNLGKVLNGKVKSKIKGWTFSWAVTSVTLDR